MTRRTLGVVGGVLNRIQRDASCGRRVRKARDLMAMAIGEVLRLQPRGDRRPTTGSVALLPCATRMETAARVSRCI